MREKLYNLIHNFIFEGAEVSDMNLADHLIENGVTVQRWIPVAERLPETTCRNLVTKYGIPFLAYYTGKEWRESGTLSVIDGITHWMPLPEPPKD